MINHDIVIVEVLMKMKVNNVKGDDDDVDSVDGCE